jgi:hypothetical protein
LLSAVNPKTGTKTGTKKCDRDPPTSRGAERREDMFLLSFQSLHHFQSGAKRSGLFIKWKN